MGREGAARKHRYFLRLFAFLWPLSLFSVAISNKAGSVPSPTLPAHTRDAGREEGPVPSAAADDEGWRRSLPLGLRNKGAPLHRVHVDGVTLYLLGSSHVSRSSCEDASLLMEHVRPDVLFLELCVERAGMLVDPTTCPDQQRTKEKGEKASMAERGSLLFAKIQGDFANKLNVIIGGEFRSAFQAAFRQQREYWSWASAPASPVAGPGPGHPTHPRAHRPCTVVLGDRPVLLTVLRAWESLRFCGKVKLVCALLWSSFRQPSADELREWLESLLNDRSGANDLMTKAISEMGTAFPTLKRTLIEERDAFMVAKLRQTAALLRLSSDHGDENVIVAVVGAGHCRGMLELLRPETLCRADARPAIPERWPALVLPALLETKKKTSYDVERASLVNGIVGFDYSDALESGMIKQSTAC